MFWSLKGLHSVRHRNWLNVSSLHSNIVSGWVEDDFSVIAGVFVGSSSTSGAQASAVLLTQTSVKSQSRPHFSFVKKSVPTKNDFEFISYRGRWARSLMSKEILNSIGHARKRCSVTGKANGLRSGFSSIGLGIGTSTGALGSNMLCRW